MAGFRRLAAVLVLVPGLAEAQTLSGAADWTVANGANSSDNQTSVNHSFWQRYTASFGSFLLDPRLVKYDAGISLGTNQLSFKNDQGAQQGGQRAVGYNVGASIFPARPFPLSVQMARDTVAESGALPTSSVIRGGIVVPAGQAVPDFQTLNRSLSVNWQFRADGLPHVDLGYRNADSLMSGGGYAAEQRNGDLHAIVSKDTPSVRQTLSFQKTSFENAATQTFNQHFNEINYDVGVLLSPRTRFTARAGRRNAFSLLDAPSPVVDAGTGLAQPLVQGRSDTTYAISGVTFEPGRRVAVGVSASLDEQRTATITTTSRLLTTTARFEPVAGLSLSAGGDYGARGQVVADAPLTVLTRMAQAGASYRAGVRWLQGSVAATRRIGENSALDGRLGQVQAWSGDASVSVSAGPVNATGGYERQHSADAILDFGNYDLRRRRASVQVTGRRFSVTGAWDRSTGERGLALTFARAVQDTYSAALSFRRHDTAIAATAGGFDSRTTLGNDRTYFAGATVESRLRRVQLSATIREESTSASATNLDQLNLVGFAKAEYTRRQFAFAVEYRRNAQHLQFAQMLAPKAYLGRQFLLRITRRFGEAAVKIAGLVWAVILTLTLGGAGLPRAQRPAPPPPRPGPEWPSPPAAARIRFLRTITPSAVRGRPSLLARIGRAIVGGGGDEPQMRQPYGIAVGPDRRVYVADTFGRAIHVYDLEKSGYSSIKVDGDSLIGVGISTNQLFVTDSASGRVLCLDARGRTLWTRGPKDGFARPTGLVVGADRLYVVDTLRHRVAMVSLTGAMLGSFGEHGNGPGQLNFPTNVAQGADGRVYVTDSMNFRVQVFDRDGRYLRGFGRLGDGSGDFDKPKGIAVDSAGHVYVVEGLHDVVQILDEAGALLLAFGESGTGDGQFWLPTGIAIVNDMVYVSDSANRRIEVFEYLKGAP